VFHLPPGPKCGGKDPFSQLPPELRQLLPLYLARSDIANLRLASASFRQLPQLYFQNLVRTEMPWIWELDTSEGRCDWYMLWCKLHAADGGAGMDEKERQWLEDVRRRKLDALDKVQEEYRKSKSRPRTLDLKEDRKRRVKKVEEEADAEIKAGYESGMWPPRTINELRGLRNRRRIWEDLEEIVRRISALPPDEME